MQLITTFKKLSLFHVALVICLVVMGFGASALAQNKVKILDIIIGGDMGIGLGCKSDSDCKTDEFCHTDQKYCVICKVPPYEWTGTECECPEGTVEKDGKTCVECLTDEHCPLNYSCDTDTNNCEYCKFPMLWQNNTCICPEGTTLQGGSCTCTQANTELNNTTGKCDCMLDEAKCTDVNFNAKECVCCSSGQPVYNGGECRSCAQLDASKPVWDSVNKACVGCKSPTPIWDGTRCVECHTNADCSGAKPVCNMTAKTCESCPSDKPVWDDGMCRTCLELDSSKPVWDSVNKACVECNTNADCNGAEPMCAYNSCETCNQATGGQKPYWNGSSCQKCEPGVENVAGDKCVIELGTGCYFNPDYGRRKSAYGLAHQGFGPFSRTYTLRIIGYSDDGINFHVNGKLMFIKNKVHSPMSCGGVAKAGRNPRGNSIGSYPTGSVRSSTGVQGGNHNRSMGQLYAGETGYLFVNSHTGTVTWRGSPAGWRIWLER